MGYALVDTSSILFGLSFNKDVIAAVSEQLLLKPAISRGVLRELEGIAENSGSRGATASTALAMLAQKSIKVYGDNGNVDRWLVGQAAKDGSAVVTNDTKLIKMLVANGITSFKVSKSGLLKRCSAR